jgi:hypothetical protein
MQVRGVCAVFSIRERPVGVVAAALICLLTPAGVFVCLWYSIVIPTEAYAFVGTIVGMASMYLWARPDSKVAIP